MGAKPPPAKPKTHRLDPQRWERQVVDLERRLQRNPPGKGSVVFIGSSSVRLWGSLAQDMAPVPVARLGFGGARTADVLHYANRLVLPHTPRAVVYYAGDNDMGRHDSPPAEQVQRDFAQFVRMIRRAGQSPEFYFVSIKPSPRRMPHWARMQKANELLQQYAWSQSGVHFVDVASPMLDASGRPRPELYADDGLHLSPRGYAVWSSVLKPILQSQVGPNPLFL